MRPTNPLGSLTQQDHEDLERLGLSVSSFKLVTYAENQPEYMPLPTVRLKDDWACGQVISCWQLSWYERFVLLFRGTFWLSQLTYGQALQPIKPHMDFGDAFEEQK